MKQLLLAVPLLFGLALGSPQASALALTFDSHGIYKIHAGDPLQLTVGISGLHSPLSASTKVDSLLGAYSFDLLYNPDDVWFPLAGSHGYDYLGLQGSEVLYSIDYLSDPGVIHFAAATLLQNQNDLLQRQSDVNGNPLDSFELADFLFIGKGTLNLTTLFQTSNIILGDFNGDPIYELDLSGTPVQDANGQLSVVSGGDAFLVIRVPLPGTASLLLAGMPWLIRRGRRAKA